MENESKTVIVEALADHLQLNLNPLAALRQIASRSPEVRSIIMKALADDKTVKEIMEDLKTVFGDYGPWLTDMLTSEADPEFISRVLRDTASIMRALEELEAERRALLKSRRNLARSLIVILGVISAAFSKISELLLYLIMGSSYDSSLSFGFVGAAFALFMIEELEVGVKWLAYYLIPFLSTTFFLSNLIG
ncbi:MAG TPA: hypothetical protein ENG61_03880 [Candidatus Korarchaeota archaeon]|nr:MAG: hypothetical protein DRO05_01390 [Candidatus Korarchaeota archaeon]HDD69480.1 hypothetical protein [Candidatus Korarchaeota archaeon]